MRESCLIADAAAQLQLWRTVSLADMVVTRHTCSSGSHTLMSAQQSAATADALLPDMNDMHCEREVYTCENVLETRRIQYRSGG